MKNYVYMVKFVILMLSLLMLSKSRADINTNNMTEEIIDLGATDTKYDIWGGDTNAQIHYPEEFLPALFERSLEILEPLEDQQSFNWMFTGPRAGITVIVKSNELEFHRRYYDSSGYYKVKGKHGRHPQWEDSVEKISSQQSISKVTVRLDYHHNFTVEINDRQVIQERWLMDLSRHQIKMYGGKSLKLKIIKPQTKKVTISVDPEKKFQKMLGFGGINTPTAYAQLSNAGKRKWWQYISEYNLLIQREYPNGPRLNEKMDNWDKLDDATPHYYGSNYPNGEISDFNYNRMIFELGGQVWFEFWKFPGWVGKDVDKYTKAMVNYCQASVKKAGQPPQIVGIQNEIGLSVDWAHRLTLGLRKALDDEGFENVKIHMSNASHLSGGIKRAEIFKSSPQVWKCIDYSASNMYDFQNVFCDIDKFDEKLIEFNRLTKDKPFLSVELCINSEHYQYSGYHVALTMGQLYHKNLTLADAAAIVYCWVNLNVAEPSYGWTRSIFVVDKENGFIPKPSSNQLRVFGAFSRRVKKDMVRVETSCYNKDVLVCSFTDDKGRQTLIAINRSINPVNMNLNWVGVNFSEIEKVNPYSPNLIDEYDPGKPIIIEPGEIITLTNVPLNKLTKGFLEKSDL